MERGSEAEAQHLTSAEYQRRNGRLPPIIGVAGGGCFHILDPREEEVHIEDIAHHLGAIGRYTGACAHLWSVGAHCLEVSRRIELRGGSKLEQLQGLLHDASEAYFVDIPRPIKPDIYLRTEAGFETYYQVEDRIMGCIFRALGVPYPLASIVKVVDDEMAHDEVANFFPPGFMWERYSIKAAKTNLVSLHPMVARDLYLRRFTELTRGGI
jgi:hypothetical protein